MLIASTPFGVAIAATAAQEPASSDSDYRQSREDAWWTGPLLAANAGALPRGHFLFEPYVFDSMTHGRYDSNGTRREVPRHSYYGSQSYVLYGFTDRVTAGLIPRFGYSEQSEGSSSSHIGVGDLSVQGQYCFTQFHEGSRVPTLSLVFGETLPTGKYDRLGDRPADGLGAGAHTTTVALYSQYFLWMPNGRIVRTRLDLSYSFSDRVSVEDMSVYGTDPGFRGHARPGDSFVADSAWEYSMTRNWVLALDIVYEHDENTRVRGTQTSQLPSGSPISHIVELNSGSGYSLSLAPAMEYNWTARVGVIAGVKLTVAGRNASAQVIPVAAINIVL